MTSPHTKSVADRAEAIYESTLREKFENEHLDRYVAIEPDSGEYFLGDTYGDAVMKARNAHPDRISFVIRVGHAAAIHIMPKTPVSSVKPGFSPHRIESCDLNFEARGNAQCP